MIKTNICRCKAYKESINIQLDGVWYSYVEYLDKNGNLLDNYAIKINFYYSEKRKIYDDNILSNLKQIKERKL